MIQQHNSLSNIPFTVSVTHQKVHTHIHPSPSVDRQINQKVDTLEDTEQQVLYIIQVQTIEIHRKTQRKSIKYRFGCEAYCARTPLT